MSSQNDERSQQLGTEIKSPITSSPTFLHGHLCCISQERGRWRERGWQRWNEEQVLSRLWHKVPRGIRQILLRVWGQTDVYLTDVRNAGMCRYLSRHPRCSPKLVIFSIPLLFTIRSLQQTVVIGRWHFNCRMGQNTDKVNPPKKNWRTGLEWSYIKQR